MNFNGILKDFKFSCPRQLFRTAEKRLKSGVKSRGEGEAAWIPAGDLPFAPVQGNWDTGHGSLGLRKDAAVAFQNGNWDWG